MTNHPHYVGRFAPSPTGPLHFGSLVAAIGSYLDARSARGQWFIRVEDLDPPRTVRGAGRHILKQLADHGLVSDHPVVYQSQRLQHFDNALSILQTERRLYSCNCPRRSYPGLYPGTCRTRELSGSQPSALRFRVGETTIQQKDLVQGAVTWTYGKDFGDFIVHRKDGLHAYQLAVVIDDIAQKVTRIVRGADLLSATPMQTCLYNALGVQSPETLHLPMVLGRDGQKLSKQTHAPVINTASAADNLNQALAFLNQPAIASDNPKTILSAAIKNWRTDRIPKLMGKTL
ncbi:MAG: tRNA glutamyl-Q(34) synthetase GluQRS [Gammaproteobacteria bacterium]|nr:tRNA glutamyl-Q(34) synthetase GluQRS [Gammaproteobacteria bacterium]